MDAGDFKPVGEKLMTIDTQADIHAHELGQQAQLEELREEAVKEAVSTLWSNKDGVLVSPGVYISAINVFECPSINYLNEIEARRTAMFGNPSIAQALYNEVAYNLLYQYADFLISNNSQPF